MTFAQVKNRSDWNAFIGRLAYQGYQPNEHSDNGWTWVEVGHNASHVFYVGHDGDYNQFAVKAMGEGCELDEDGMTVIETHIHRHSPTLRETVEGAYLGHD